VSHTPVVNAPRNSDSNFYGQVKKKVRKKLPYISDLKLNFFSSNEQRLSYIAERANNFLYKNLKEALENSSSHKVSGLFLI